MRGVCRNTLRKGVQREKGQHPGPRNSIYGPRQTEEPTNWTGDEQPKGQEETWECGVSWKPRQDSVFR